MHRADDYSLHGYGRMISDRDRSQPYIDALRRLVTRNSVVLEIGTAAGYFAFFCAQLGAKRIYAVEPDSSIEVARLCAQDIPGAERIIWIKGLSTAIDLPEKADLVFGDLHGSLPFYNHNIDSMIDARLRHLKPGGTILPMRDVLRVVPAQAPHEYQSIEMPWLGNPEGLDLSAGQPYVANHWWRAHSAPAKSENLLAQPATWGVVDYREVTSSSMDGRLEWVIDRPGTLHGYYVWFDGELADGIGYSNAPDRPELVYSRSFFPLEQAVEVAPGDQIDLHLSVKRIDTRNIFRWDSRISASDGIEKNTFRQSTFRSSPIDRNLLTRVSTDHVPQLGLDGQIDLGILQAMMQKQPIGEIAESMRDKYGQVFPTAADALRRVSKLSMKYSERGSPKS